MTCVMQGMTVPASWHSHIYFDASSHDRAAAVLDAMQAHFPAESGIIYGRWHHKPVGPHPDFSIQLEYSHAQFADVMAWLAQNRDGLTIFSHPNTGDSDAAQLRDHRDHAVWMGAVRPLKLSRFGGVDQRQM